MIPNDMIPQIEHDVFEHIFKDKMSPAESLCFTIYVDYSMSKNTSLEWIIELTGLEIKLSSFRSYVRRARKKYRENRSS